MTTINLTERERKVLGNVVGNEYESISVTITWMESEAERGETHDDLPELKERLAALYEILIKLGPVD
jgi:hypothetical protein